VVVAKYNAVAIVDIAFVAPRNTPAFAADPRFLAVRSAGEYTMV
jgi:hypothetical protein